jgi:hypothetical protein
MNNKSTYLSNKLLNHVLSGQVYTPPGPNNLYLALLSTPPSDNNIIELPSANGYARTPITFSVAGSTPQTNGISTNTSQVLIGPATASWGTLAGIALFDAPTGGNLLYWAEISPALNATQGFVFVVLPNGITLGED